MRSREITAYKRKIMSAIVGSEEIVNAIAEPNITIDNADELINLCIFDYNKIPSITEAARNFITIQINIPRIEKGNVWREVIVVIRTITHIDKMELGGSKGNRMDYISSQLDELLSEREDFGFGRLLITSNSEGSISDKFLARTMTFSVNDLNKVGCSS
jgi:hypothetical protein